MENTSESGKKINQRENSVSYYNITLHCFSLHAAVVNGYNNEFVQQYYKVETIAENWFKAAIHIYRETQN